MPRPTKSQGRALRRMYDNAGTVGKFLLPEPCPKTGHHKIHGHTVNKLVELGWCCFGMDERRPVFCLTNSGWLACAALFGDVALPASVVPEPVAVSEPVALPSDPLSPLTVELSDEEVHAFAAWLAARRAAPKMPPEAIKRAEPIPMDLPPDHDAWLELRKLSIGSSDVATVLGINPWSGPWKLWALKTGKIPNEDAGWYAALGTKIEPLILDLAGDALGVEVMKPAHAYRHGLISCLTANLDGLARDPLDSSRTVIVEAKHGSLYAKKAIEAFRDHGHITPGSDVQRWYYQIQEQLAVMSLDTAYLAALVNKDFYTVRIERDERAISTIERECAAFWDRFVAGPDGPKPPPASAADLGTLASVAEPDPEATTEIDDLASEVIRVSEISEELRALKSEKDGIDAKIRQALGDSGIGTVEGVTRVRVSMTERSGLDTKRLRSEQSDLLKQYETSSQSSRLTYAKVTP